MTKMAAKYVQKGCEPKEDSTRISHSGQEVLTYRHVYGIEDVGLIHDSYHWALEKDRKYSGDALQTLTGFRLSEEGRATFTPFQLLFLDNVLPMGTRLATLDDIANIWQENPGFFGEANGVFASNLTYNNLDMPVREDSTEKYLADSFKRRLKAQMYAPLPNQVHMNGLKIVKDKKVPNCGLIPNLYLMSEIDIRPIQRILRDLNIIYHGIRTKRLFMHSFSSDEDCTKLDVYSRDLFCRVEEAPLILVTEQSKSMPGKVFS